MEIKDQEVYKAGQRFGRFLTDAIERHAGELIDRILKEMSSKNTVEGTAIVLDVEQKTLPAPQQENE